MNRIIEGNATGSPAGYVFGPPERLKHAFRWLLFVVSCVPLTYAMVMAEQLEVAELFGLFGLAFGLVLAARSRAMQMLGVCFIADRQGLHFPHPPRLFAETPDFRERWLRVAWPNVIAISADEMLVGESGMAPCIKLTLAIHAPDEQAFFAHLTVPWQRESPGHGRLAVRYHSGTAHVDEALRQLHQLRSAYLPPGEVASAQMV